jgi:hypothetical protein
MKKLRLIIAGLFIILTGAIHAQIGIEVRAGVVPGWAPADAEGVRFYYIPDIDVYYDVNTADYIYLSDGVWVHARSLPPAYAHYDIWGGYKVVLRDYHGERPYEYYERHRHDYPHGYNHGHEQKTYGHREEHHEEHHDEHHDDHDHR